MPRNMPEATKKKIGNIKKTLINENCVGIGILSILKIGDLNFSFQKKN